jgi:hypothetical protein
MKIWISKYALSGGISEYECAEPHDGYAYPGDPFPPYASFKVGRDAHATREDAVKAAEAARTKKIASVRKQLARLEALRFDA